MIIDGIIQKVAECTPEQRLNLARNSYADLMTNLTKNCGLSDEEAVTVFITFLKVFVSADKVCSEEEYQLFKVITGVDMDSDTFYEMTNGGSDPKLVDIVDKFIDNLDDEDGKPAAVILAVCFMGVDGEITQSERLLLQKFFD